MSSYDKSRKAAGSSSDPLRQNRRKSSSASQPKYKYERPPISPCNNTADSLSYVPPLRTSHQSQGPSTSTSARRMSSQASTRPQYHEAQVSSDDMSFRSARDGNSSKKSSPTTSSVLLHDDEVDDDSDDSWDMLERETPNHKTPTSYFHGTWPTALHDTSVAAKQVGAATYSYVNALTQSGIGQAGWSIGSALAASGKRGAKKVAGWWNRANGVQQGGFRGWKQEGGHRSVDDEVWGDERGLYVLDQKEMDGTGELVGEGRRVYRGGEQDGFREEEMMGGGGGARVEDQEEAEAGLGEDGLMRLFEFDD